jgi:DNA repair protein RecO (recombination protein O)
MLHKTRGIVLHTLKYGDNGLIVKIYTEQFGLQGYIANHSKSKSSKIKTNLFQPLALLDLIVYHKTNSGLHRINELKMNTLYQSIPTDIIKSSLIIFLNEVLYKCLREEERNETLFEFLFNSLQILDLKTTSVANFHLSFLLQFSRFLGFSPHNNFSEENCYFDLQSGYFISDFIASPLILDQNTSLLLNELIEHTYNDLEKIVMNYQQRKVVLNAILKYYELHVSNFSLPKSLEILEEVLG